MKFFIAFIAIVAVASANKPIDASAAELDAIIAAIQSPNTDPATAALLEQQLHDIIAGLQPENEPIAVHPVIVDEYKPIAVGPAIVDEIIPSPAAPAPSSPLVQIIVNVQSNSVVGGSPVVVDENPSPAPVPVPEPVIIPDPVIVAPLPLPEIEADPVIVVPVPIEPEIVPEPAPIVPEPVVIDPEILN